MKIYNVKFSYSMPFLHCFTLYIIVYVIQADDEVEDDPDKLKPYKKDLEYLDDHFKLITLKLKVKGVDSRIEMEVSEPLGIKRDQGEL